MNHDVQLREINSFVHTMARVCEIDFTQNAIEYYNLGKK